VDDAAAVISSACKKDTSKPAGSQPGTTATSHSSGQTNPATSNEEGKTAGRHGGDSGAPPLQLLQLSALTELVAREAMVMAARAGELRHSV
jgi:hypothetical protein